MNDPTYSTVDPGWRNVEHPACSPQRTGAAISELARGMYKTYVEHGADLRQLIIDAQVQAAAYYTAAIKIYVAQPIKPPPRPPTDAELLAELEGECTPDREACEHIARRFRQLVETAGPTCYQCGAPIFGGPGGWHVEDGSESCPEGVLQFHEPVPVTSQTAQAYLFAAERWIGAALRNDSGEDVPDLDERFLAMIRAGQRYRVQPAAPADIPAPGGPLPKAPDGYACCRVRGGDRYAAIVPDAVIELSHLVTVVDGGFRGPTLCGLTRFDDRADDGVTVTRKADLPGWDMNGGFSGPGVTQMKCGACWAKIR